MIGNTVRNYRNEAACAKNSGKNHHKLLHDDFWEEGQTKVKMSVNCNLGRQSSSFSDSTFLQIMPVTLESKLLAVSVSLMGLGFHCFSHFEFYSQKFTAAWSASLRCDGNSR